MIIVLEIKNDATRWLLFALLTVYNTLSIFMFRSWISKKIQEMAISPQIQKNKIYTFNKKMHKTILGHRYYIQKTKHTSLILDSVSEKDM